MQIKVIGKRICEVIGNQLIKFEWFRREVEYYKIRQEKQIVTERMQRNRDEWSDFIKAGNRENKDGPMLAVGVDTRMMGHEPFNPVFSREDCLAWGVKVGEKR